MAAYVGILSNTGKILDNDEAALAYAFEKCGIEPTESWLYVDDEFGEMMLEWFYSGDWVRYRDINDVTDI
ncbi:MAG: hypothetical protein PHH84_05355 [Oscillospiraceae bacterium]|nr:hypothetical protein [Oscillospiraceae bacterium]MDD4414042.1 hypothetical protein [Oscillospiraceae bacterium]